MLDVNFSPIANVEIESGVATAGYSRSKQSDDTDVVEDSVGVTDSESGGSSSVLTASFNFINSIVGAGIIGIPYAVQQCGFVSGVLMLAFVAYLVYRSVTILIDCGVKANKLDFEELAEHLLGRPGYFAVLIFMFLFAYGAQIAYLVVIGDTIPIVAELFLPNSILANRNITIALTSIFVILPLCLLKDLSSLSWTSMLSIGADIALVLIVLIAAPSASVKEGIKHDEISILNPSVFVGIGTMSFAFVCQHNSFIVFRTLKERTVENWQSVAKGSIFFSFLMCSTLGIAGYLSFLEETEGDILNNFPKTGVVVSAARVLLAFCMVFTYPMECIVTRHCLLSIVSKIQEGRLDKIFTLVKNEEGSGSSGSESSESPRSPKIQKFFGGTNPMTKNFPQLNGSRNVRDIDLHDNIRDDKVSKVQNGKKGFHGFLKREKSERKAGDSEDYTQQRNGNELDLLPENDNEEVSIYFGEGENVHNGNGNGNGNGNDDSGGRFKKRGSGTRSGSSEGRHGRLNNIECDKDGDDVVNRTSRPNPNRHDMSTLTSTSSTANEKSEIEEKSNNKFSPYSVKERNTGTETSSNFTEIFYQDGDDNMSEECSEENKRRECSSAGKMIRIGKGDDYDTNSNNNNHNKIQSNIELSNLGANNNGNQNSKNNCKFNDFEDSVNKIDETVTRKFPGSGFYYKILATRCSKSIKRNFFPDKNAASRVGVTLLLWGSSVVIALLFRDLGMVQALTGAVAASMLGYVLPGVLYIRTHHREAREILNDLFGKDESFEAIVDTNSPNVTDCDSDAYMNSYIDNDSDNRNDSIKDNNDNNHSNHNGINSHIDNNSNGSSREIAITIASSPTTDSDSEVSPTNHCIIGQNSVYNSQTKRLIIGKKRKTVHQKLKLMSRFFMPLFLIVFGLLAAVVGVTSVFFF